MTGWKLWIRVFMPRVQNSLVRVVSCSNTNTTSALNSLHWLPIQQRINFKLATHVHRSLLIFTTSLYAIASASFCLPQSSLPTSYQHSSCHSWFSTCWPFSLESPSSSSLIYHLLHCLQIQSKNSRFLWYLWPLKISIHVLLIQHNQVDLCILKLCYVMLC